MRFSRSAQKRQHEAQAHALKLAQYTKKENVHENNMIKNFKAEKEKQDFLRGKSHEKYNSVLTKKKEIDNNYEIKMKDLARRIKMKECHGNKSSPEAIKKR